MKKIICLLICSILIGCSAYHTKMTVDPVNAPDSSTQILRNEPLMSSAKSAVFFDKNNIEELKNFMDGYKDRNYLPSFSVISKSNENVSILTSTVKNFINHYKNLFTGKVYVDILDSSNSVGQIDGDFLTSGITTITTEGNFKYDLKRLNLLSSLINDELAVSGFNITKNIEDADYKIKIIVIEDGMTAKSTIGFLYSRSKKTGIVGLDIKIIDLKSNDIVLAYRTKNSTYFSKVNILYFIPTYHSSENLDMEY